MLLSQLLLLLLLLKLPRCLIPLSRGRANTAVRFGRLYCFVCVCYVSMKVFIVGARVRLSQLLEAAMLEPGLGCYRNLITMLVTN
ncbi:hypothetical protein T492DRAFT_1047729 [Pavlovales sp. CCMP2436]|nr:hypothetical protein T492DRAFT_1047729 [Pavlovales sp. CCMP2436]